MPKVITFSQLFPASHAHAGVPTWFVERIWHGLRGQFDSEMMHAYLDEQDKKLWEINRISWLALKGIAPKIHTIRAGHSRKVGDVFAPRIWSGKPYASKQVQFAPDLTMRHIVNFERTADRRILLNETDCTFHATTIADNDGLTLDEFWAWFDKPFIGQVLIWAEENPYTRML